MKTVNDIVRESRERDFTTDRDDVDRILRAAGVEAADKTAQRERLFEDDALRIVLDVLEQRQDRERAVRAARQAPRRWAHFNKWDDG